MEEYKDIEKKNKEVTSLPSTLGLQYSDNEIEEERKSHSNLPGRIANALTESMSATYKSIERKYGLTIQDAEIKQAVDGNGRISKPSAMQKRILLSLEYQLSLLSEKKNVKEYLEALKDKQSPSENLREYISLEDICRDVHGEEERWKSDKQKRILTELQALSKKKQLHIYKAEVRDDNGNVVEGQVKEFFPYINLTGKEIHIQVGKRTAIAVEIEFSRIFLERQWDRYYFFLPSFWDAVGSNGRRITTDHFTSLFTLAMNKSWSHLHHDLPEAIKYIKKEGILDPEKIKQIKEKALTHAPISFSEIRESMEERKDSREERRRFKYYIWEAMYSLINMGIITESSVLDTEKETVTLVYNENPTIARNGEPGGVWAKNPYPYKKQK